MSARADLGDSEPQLITHDGAETGTKTSVGTEGGAVAIERISFQKSGFQYDIVLFKGISSEESVYHRPASPLTAEEVKALLQTNVQGQVWKEIPPQPEFTTWLHALQSWQRTDGAIASLEGPKNNPRLLFHIKAKELVKAEKAAQTSATAR
jgi:hypothetical protein